MDQPLSSAKYVMEVPPSEAPLPAPPSVPKPVRARYSAQQLLRVTKITALFVTTAVVTCGGALLWLNRHDLQESAQSARRRTSNPIDFMLWFGGSDKTFEDAILEASERNRLEFEAMRDESPLYNGDFEASLEDLSFEPMDSFGHD